MIARASLSVPMAAKVQKAESAGSCEVDPSAKASTSVIDVTVIDTPACDIACAIRSAAGIETSVASRAFTSTNMSSTYACE